MSTALERMWGDRHAWDRVYVGRSTRLGDEKEAVCIVSGEGVYVGRSTRLGHENGAVCIVSGGYRDGRVVTCSCVMISVFAAFRRRSRGYPGEGLGGEAYVRGSSPVGSHRTRLYVCDGRWV